MIVDHFGCMVREQNDPGTPGRVGSSAADTSRYLHLSNLLGIRPYEVNINQFVTNDGFIDHPNSIWREDKFTCDSLIPLYLAADGIFKTAIYLDYFASLQALIKRRTMVNGWKTGDGKYINPGTYFLLNDNKFELKTSLFIQSLLFKLPYRWSDSTKWLEKNNENPGDYLNYTHLSLYVGKSYVPKEKLKQKIEEYWIGGKKPEPNIDWLLNMYREAINKFL